MVEQGFAVLVNADGVYASGFTSGTLPGQFRVGAQDAFVSRYDPSGNLIWTRQFGTPNNDVVFALATSAVGLFVIGMTEGAMAGASSGGQDIFGALFDSSGFQLGTVQLGSSANDLPQGAAADANSVYIAGRTEGTLPGQSSAGAADAFAGRFTNDGTPIWIVQFGTSAADSALGIAVDGSSAFVSGSTSGALPGQSSAGAIDAYLRKYSLTGSEMWTLQFGTDASDSATEVVVDGSGVYVIGSTGGTLPGQTSAGGTDAFLRKYDHDGSEVWTRQFGTSGTDSAVDVAVTATGIYVQGRTTGTLPGQTSAGLNDGYLRKYDAEGNEQWTVQFGTVGDDMSGGGAVDADATGAYIVGDTASGRAFPGQTNAGSLDVFLLKIAAVQMPPAVSQGGVVNNASYAPNPAPVAPGSIAAVFGSNLNNGSTVLFSSFGPNNRLVTTLGGTSVTFNGVSAPMFYSTTGQLGVQVPFELAGQTSANVVVTIGGQSSPSRTVFLDSFAPGIFTVNQAGTGIAAVLHQDGVTPVTVGNPARRNEVVVFYGTGLGALNPALATGAPSTGNLTATAATVTVDGVAATVEFSGTAPGFVGLNQVNVRIPASTRQSSTIPVVLSVGGKQSNPVTIPVAP